MCGAGNKTQRTSCAMGSQLVEAEKSLNEQEKNLGEKNNFSPPPVTAPGSPTMKLFRICVTFIVFLICLFGSKRLKPGER